MSLTGWSSLSDERLLAALQRAYDGTEPRHVLSDLAATAPPAPKAASRELVVIVTVVCPTTHLALTAFEALSPVVGGLALGRRRVAVSIAAADPDGTS